MQNTTHPETVRPQYQATQCCDRRDAVQAQLGGDNNRLQAKRLARIFPENVANDDNGLLNNVVDLGGSKLKLQLKPFRVLGFFFRV